MASHLLSAPVPSIICFLIILSLSFAVLVPSLTVLLAVVTSFRHRFRGGGKTKWSDYSTALYGGRVSHTRFLPVPHAFSYPLFFCCLDLSEEDVLFRGRGDLWPLSLLMQFRGCDHLKNGEGMEESISDNGIHARVRRLVTERTSGKCAPGAERRILLVTHLSYFGYCFNPVSFYYVLKDVSSGEEEIDAVVAEVSNTPWNEMRCYVLHSDSKDVTTVRPGRVKSCSGSKVARFPSDDDSDLADSDAASQGRCKGGGEGGVGGSGWKSTNYIFPKMFHVSPFMEMDHTYDWTFWTPRRDRITVSTTMIKGKAKFFNAYFDIRRRPFAPLELCLQLIRLPVYCVIIQIWIHVEAFWIFLKGVEFVPHPEGTETLASRIIGQFMVPFFAVKDRIEKWKRDRGDGGKSKKD